MKKILNALRDVIFFVLFFGLVIYIVCVSSGYKPDLFGYRVLRVLTSSMDPAITENTCIIIKEVPQEEIAVGDIITFESNDPSILGYLNTHRVASIEERDGETVYITRGDHNLAVDLYPVSYNQIYGKFQRVMPFGQEIGNLITTLVDQKIYFLVLILPLMLCLISYIWQIYRIVTSDDDEEDDDEAEGEEEDEAENEAENAIDDEAENAIDDEAENAADNEAENDEDSEAENENEEEEAAEEYEQIDTDAASQTPAEAETARAQIKED